MRRILKETRVSKSAKASVLAQYYTEIGEREKALKYLGNAVRHEYPQRQIQGGVLEREAPIKLDKLRVVCPECSQPTRLGRKRLEDGRGVRVCKKCNATLS